MQSSFDHCVLGILFMPAALACAVLVRPAPASAAGPVLPEIRMSSSNPVPACVTPKRLMSFLTTRNRRLNPRFKNIAMAYKYHGESWRVRWDYAFFQMAIETNFLTYRAPNGRMGDVDPSQNNFAGIGTTGGGVPGNRFPNVSTGVLAQIQHLVVYSGERIAEPVAPRTRLKQDHILALSWKLRRPVRFSDLSRRWAVDKNYGRSIEWVAKKFRSRYCRGGGTPQRKPTPQKEVLPWAKSAAAKGQKKSAAKQTPRLADKATAQMDVPRLVKAPRIAVKQTDGDRTALNGKASNNTAAEARRAFDPRKTPPAGLGAETGACQVRSASYGGRKTLLIRTADARATQYTVLTVHDGFERSMTASFLESQPAGGESLGAYASKDDALDHARQLCSLH